MALPAEAELLAVCHEAERLLAEERLRPSERVVIQAEVVQLRRIQRRLAAERATESFDTLAGSRAAIERSRRLIEDVRQRLLAGSMRPALGDLRVRTIPSSDAEFAEAAADALHAVAGEDVDDLAGQLAAALRGRYPGVTCHRMTELGSPSPHPLVWYVYRDGAR